MPYVRCKEVHSCQSIDFPVHYKDYSVEALPHLLIELIMVATTVLVALLACQICVIDGYKLANTRMQISMASSNPFGSFMGGMNKPSSSSGGNDPPR